MTSKEQLLKEACAHVSEIVDVIGVAKSDLDVSIVKKEVGLKSVSSRDRHIESEVLEYNKKRTEELAILSGSPYFFKCDVKFDDANESEQVHIGKFNFSERQIYSWLSPVAKLRFEDIGNFSYTRPNGEVKSGKLMRKDQFMIADSQIIYMASESTGSPRQLIYQEHLSNRKAGFMLPEVIAKMEKQQDEVIRADFRGSYLISGPAGSGKTTLALHRVAYLAQSPDTSEQFPSNNIILFVQDDKTLEYFQAIFPQLGINDVLITTFQQWALKLLNISDCEFVYRYGGTEIECDEYEYMKQTSLKKFAASHTNITLRDLGGIYNGFENLFSRQMSEKKLDRFDLIILLLNQYYREGALKKEAFCVVKKKNGQYKSEQRMLPLKYSLMIVDEVQNYLAEEIMILKSCINANSAMLYTGDLAQKTKLCTIEDWSQAGEIFTDGRKIVLDKVYRSTKEILAYIRSRGYDVDIPKELRSGTEVVERRFSVKGDELMYVKEVVEKNSDTTIGILNNSGEYLNDYKNIFAEYKNVHMLTTLEAQGVEFEILILVGHEADKVCDYADEKLRTEKRRVERDLNYVAMTRAMNELYVCATKSTLDKRFFLG